MKSLFIVIVLSVLLGCQTTSTYTNDKYLNISFYSNCLVPKDSVKIIKNDSNRYTRFQLKNFQKGGCTSDRTARHSAPYWERSELKQNGFLDINGIYEIKFKVRFVEGFRGNREAFFQIHQTVPNCRTGPITMLKFSSDLLRLDAKRNLKNNSIYISDVRIEELLKKWTNFKIIYDMEKKKINVFLNEGLIFKNINFVSHPCGRPHIKYGIYRPGSEYQPNNTSAVDFEKFQVRKIQ